MLNLLEKSKYAELKGFVERRSSVSMEAGASGSLAADIQQFLAAAPKVGRGVVSRACSVAVAGDVWPAL